MATTAERMVDQLARHEWRSIVAEGARHRLEIHPAHGKRGAAFTLWERGEDGREGVVVSGHTERGHLVTVDGSPLRLADDLERTLNSLIDAVPSPAEA